MLILLSPAKSLDFETPVHTASWSHAQFLGQAEILMARLRALAPGEIADLMSVSDALALLNFHRFADWQPPFTLDNARQSVLAFAGDVYDGLSASTLSADDLAFAQAHLLILSGLYGLLRPLDLIQPYRLEMRSRLETDRGQDLYAFWGALLTNALNARLAAMARPVVINLASVEYFRAVQGKQLQGQVIQPVFEDWKGGKYRIISFYAKRARGLMARYAIEQRITQPEALQGFDHAGYIFAPEVSDGTTWFFRRRVT